MKKATLTLDDGTTFDGFSFGYDTPITQGETVFSTAMVGYTESLTDPSYAGQILVMTYPLVGNYGVPIIDHDQQQLPRATESNKIHITALVVADYCYKPAHWNKQQTLAHWLWREHVVGITAVDTRALTKILRQQGVMRGQITIDNDNCQQQSTPYDCQQYENINFVEQVSTKQIITYQPTRNNTRAHAPRVVLVDCGVKTNIIRCLLQRGLQVIRVPWDYNFNNISFDALFLTNGPGNPDTCNITVEHIRQFLNAAPIRPCMGICMGNQLLAKAAGATIYKMKYGHRSHNQPVRLVNTNTCFVTAQNHGYAVDDKSLPNDWTPLFVNINDGTNEGIKHKTLPWFSAQFHPEAAAGPIDTEHLFDNFASIILQTIQH